MRTLLGILVVVMLMGTFVTSLAVAAPPIEQPFPLVKGAYWTYSGPTKWTPDGADQPSEKELTWKMEITAVIQRDQVTAASVLGYPMDLAFYQEGMQPGKYLLVGIANQKYYLLSGDRVTEALKQLADPDDPLVDFVHDTELILDLPLAPNKIFGETAQLARPDRMYFWVVTKEHEAKLSHVKGAPSSKMLGYKLTFTTLSDSQAVEFVPGVGITEFASKHNGTVSETNLKLVEFHSGAPASN